MEITPKGYGDRIDAYKKGFNLEIEKAYAIGLTAIHIHSFPYLLEEFIDSLYY